MKLSELQLLISPYLNKLSLTNITKIKEILLEYGIDPGEMHRQLEMDSKYIDIHKDVSYPSDDIRLHSHAFYEILFCCNSWVDYLLDGKQCRIESGDIIFVPPEISHQPLFKGEGTAAYDRYAIWISRECFGLFAQLFPDEPLLDDKPLVIHSSPEYFEQLKLLLSKSLRESLSGSACSDTLIFSYITQILVMLHRMAPTAQPTATMRAEDNLLEEIIVYLEQHLQDKITLQDMAHRFHASQSSISQLFRKELGTSFYHFLTQRRLLVAKGLLKQKSSATEISQLIGFSDYSTFYRAFKKEYGISPLQYRQQILLAEQETMS